LSFIPGQKSFLKTVLKKYFRNTSQFFNERKESIKNSFFENSTFKGFSHLNLFLVQAQQDDPYSFEEIDLFEKFFREQESPVVFLN